MNQIINYNKFQELWNEKAKCPYKLQNSDYQKIAIKLNNIALSKGFCWNKIFYLEMQDFEAEQDFFVNFYFKYQATEVFNENGKFMHIKDIKFIFQG